MKQLFLYILVWVWKVCDLSHVDLPPANCFLDCGTSSRSVLHVSLYAPAGRPHQISPDDEAGATGPGPSSLSLNVAPQVVPRARSYAPDQENRDLRTLTP